MSCYMDGFNEQKELNKYTVVGKQIFSDAESVKHFAENMVQSAYIEYLKIMFMDKIMPNAKKGDDIYELIMLQINYAFNHISDDLIICVEEFIKTKKISDKKINGYSLLYIADILAKKDKSGPRFDDFLFLNALPIMKRYINSKNKSLDSILDEFYFDWDYEYEFLWRNLSLFAKKDDKKKVLIYSKFGILNCFKGKILKYINTHHILNNVRFHYELELKDAIYNMPKELVPNFIQFVNNESITNIVINDMSIPQLMKKYESEEDGDNEEFHKLRQLSRYDMQYLNYKERFIHSAYEMIKNINYFSFNFDECYKKYLKENNEMNARNLATYEYKLSIVVNGVFKLSHNVDPYDFDFEKKKLMIYMVNSLPDRLLTNIVEWINGNDISDIYYYGWSIPSIMKSGSSDLDFILLLRQ